MIIVPHPLRYAARIAATLVLAFSAGISLAYAQTDITQTDWKAVLAADPKLKRPSSESPLNDKYPYVSSGKVEGYAIFDNVIYGDFSGDGLPEAVIPLASGGTAGDIGVLLYKRNARGKPELVTGVTGYKMSAQIANGDLLLSQAQYAGWEGNCCPSAQATVRYQLRGSRLLRRGASVTPYQAARGPTLIQFFDLINAKQPKLAYAFLTPAEKRRNPYVKWVKEFTDLADGIEVQGVTDSNSDTVIALVRAKEREGKQIRSAAEVKMIWSDKAKQWLIEDVSGNTLPDKAEVIAGKLGFPSEEIPALLVVAREIKTGKIFQIATARGQGAYALIVEPGTYTLVAYLEGAVSGDRNGGGYTAAVACGLNADCKDHTLTPVIVTIGSANVAADLTDWFADENAFPPRP